jgi:NTP pyrophosphatase (non-canonical NTP hydrolase)
METTQNSIQKLTALQKEVGYSEGDLNIIAVLGLFGEAGEVLNEIAFIEESHHSNDNEVIRHLAVEIAGLIDSRKKRIRDGGRNPIKMVYEYPKFDEELADLLYYINALAINRGKTLEDYAALSVKKVQAKRVADISHGKVSTLKGE